MVKPAELLLLSQPQAPHVAARVSLGENFQHLMPLLPKFLDIRPRSTNFDLWRSSGLSIKPHILGSGLRNQQSKRPAHREPERAHRVKEIRPLRVVEQIYDL